MTIQQQRSFLKNRNAKGMFVVDLDGTLLNSDRQISDGDLNSLASLQRHGYLVVVATGRSNYSFEQLLKRRGYTSGEAPLPFDYVIFSTGAGIMDFPGRDLLKSFSLKGEDIRLATHLLDALGLDYMVHKSVPDTRYFFYKKNGRDNDDFTTRIQMYRDFASPLTTEHLLSIEEATEVLCIVPEDTGHQRAVDISQALSGCSVIKATSPLDGRSVWIEIFSPTVSKSRAVQWLAEKIDLEHCSIGAVGNDYNDEDLLYWVDHGFIMSNSPPSMKKTFPVVATNDQDGVSEAVCRWLKKLP